MARPNRDRTKVSVHLGQEQLDLLDEAAEQFSFTRAEMIRQTLRVGLPLMQRSDMRSSGGIGGVTP